MTKESIVALQKVDCNCNDCGFMVRDFERFNVSVKQHHEWQLDLFTTNKAKLLEKAQEWEKKGDTDKGTALREEAAKMNFVFDKSECHIQFGNCTQFNTPVSFIPGVLQLETQGCFVHRKGN